MDKQTLQRELRRNENTLVVAGAGMIAFGLWSIVKAVLSLALQTDKMLDELGVLELTETREQAILAAYFAVILVVSVDLLLRLYVGLSARKDGLTGKRRGAYIVVLCLMAVFTLLSDRVLIMGLSKISLETAENMIASFVVELTSTVVTIELLVAAINVRRLRKALAEKEG